MNVVLPFICIITSSLQSVFKKILNTRCRDCEFSISMMISLFALIYFIVFSDGFVFDKRLILYCIAFSVCYATAAATCVLALFCGSLALTDLALVYSVVLPLGYSLAFCNESLNMLQVMGIILLGLSFLFTYCRREKNVSKTKLSLKWIIYTSLLFLSNGMCGVIQRMQQRAFDGATDSSFMIISLIMVVLILLIMAFVRERDRVFKALKNGLLLTGLCGICNGATNYFALLCLMFISGCVYYPLTSAGGIVLTYIFSITLFKEKFSTKQIAGFMLAILSMIFINIK